MIATCTYLLPFRRSAFQRDEMRALTRYFETLRGAGCEVLVIDGSPEDVFPRHKEALGSICRHEPVDRSHGYLNDKVNGVHTGVALASFERIFLADDDIRYTAEQITECLQLLEKFEVVRPQNFLRPLPWWAKMEAARMLINRGTLRAADYPGTCVFWRKTLLACGHYDGDVLFDNEEIIRHFAAHGCRIAYANNLFVRKRPPTFRKWIEQRPRQAYEDFGMRAKTALFFSLPPLFLLIAICFGKRGVVAFAGTLSLGASVLAWKGRARGTAAAFFPRRCCLWAPFWVVERSLSTYWAFWWFVRRGGYPFGERILSKGVGRAWRTGARAVSAQLRQMQKS